MPRISHKISNDSVNTLTSIAGTTARKSECIQKLGAVITKGRTKIIFRGYNDVHRTAYLNNISNCLHAEMSVATKFINSHVRPNHIKVFNAL